jgi:hypothetical protein
MSRNDHLTGTCVLRLSLLILKNVLFNLCSTKIVGWSRLCFVQQLISIKASNDEIIVEICSEINCATVDGLLPLS